MEETDRVELVDPVHVRAKFSIHSLKKSTKTSTLHYLHIHYVSTQLV